MKMDFEFTEMPGIKKHKYRHLEDVEEVRKFGDKLEDEFGSHFHVHRHHGPEDEVWNSQNKPLYCSHINYKPQGNKKLTEILFQDAKKIKGIPESYFLYGPKIHIYLENIETDQSFGVKGYVRLPIERDVSKLESFVTFIEDFCREK